MHFYPGARFLITDRRYNFVTIPSVIYLLGSIFSIIVWTNILHDFDEGICFPENCCYENG